MILRVGSTASMREQLSFDAELRLQLLACPFMLRDTLAFRRDVLYGVVESKNILNVMFWFLMA